MHAYTYILIDVLCSLQLHAHSETDSTQTEKSSQQRLSSNRSQHSTAIGPPPRRGQASSLVISPSRCIHQRAVLADTVSYRVLDNDKCTSIAVIDCKLSTTNFDNIYWCHRWRCDYFHCSYWNTSQLNCICGQNSCHHCPNNEPCFFCKVIKNE